MTIAVKVKCFNGQSYDLSVEPETDSVSDFQKKVSDASGIAPERQTILCKGKVLDEGGSISDYGFSEGVTISVVRRVGKAPAATATSKPDAAPAKLAEKSEAVEGPAPASTEPDAMPSLEEMMRNLGGPGGLGGAPGGPGGAGGMGNMANLAAMLNGGGGGLGGAGAGGAGGAPPNMDSIMQQLPAMMNGLLNTPMLQDFLQDPAKQEESRAALMNSPLLKHVVDSDPEFAKVVNDPEKWKASMAAARSLFDAQQGPASGGTASARSAPGKPDEKKKTTPAAEAPPGVDIGKLSESYGHALGQSLINSGLGLDPELVVKGLRSAVDGASFPMALPEYERSMAQLQGVAAEFLSKANLEDANNLFEEIKEDAQAVIVEEGKIAYERSDAEPDETAPAAKEGANVLVIVSARLLDGRHFFTCPAADETGESVHPLTLDLESAPRALAKGIVGMREGETRVLYVHPTACEGMAEMFGDLLPANSLLIFDTNLVSANSPREDGPTAADGQMPGGQKA